MNNDIVLQIAALPTVGERITAAREHLGISRLEMARRLGISSRSLRRQETGCNLPNFEACEAMIREFGDWRIVFGEEVDSPEPPQ